MVSVPHQSSRCGQATEVPVKASMQLLRSPLSNSQKHNLQRHHHRHQQAISYVQGTILTSVLTLFLYCRHLVMVTLSPQPSVQYSHGRVLTPSSA